MKTVVHNLMGSLTLRDAKVKVTVREKWRVFVNGGMIIKLSEKILNLSFNSAKSLSSSIISSPACFQHVLLVEARGQGYFFPKSCTSSI